MFKNYSINHFTAGFVTVLVGFTSSVALVFQAAIAAGGDIKDVASWIFALSIGMALAAGYFSFKYKMPMLFAWSTPGAAILIVSLTQFTKSEAIGAFVMSSLLIILFGLTGWFEKLINKLPLQIASAMLAGVLFKFGLDVFVNMKTELYICLGLFIIYIFSKRLISRFTMVAVLCAAIFITIYSGKMSFDAIKLEFIQPIFTMPEFSFKALIGLTIPLFIVTMTAQNIPGVTILNAHKYFPPISKVLTGVGLLNLFLAPFGAFSLNFAAITAAISMEPGVDADPKQRYKAAITAALFYFLIALCAGSVASLFYAFPKEIVMTIAGLALFNTIGNSLLTALKDESPREAAFITFLVAVSGVSILGIGSAFWSLVIGLFSYTILSYKKMNHSS